MEKFKWINVNESIILANYANAMLLYQPASTSTVLERNIHFASAVDPLTFTHSSNGLSYADISSCGLASNNHTLHLIAVTVICR